jgi:hypothetical protein
MSDLLQDAPARDHAELPFAVELELHVTDRETIAELVAHAEGGPRDEFALEALKIGVLALRRASSALDGEFIRRETDRLLEGLAGQLTQHANSARERLESTLGKFFDPDGGQFTERVRQLTSPDGQFGAMVRSLVDGDDSRLAKTMLAHVGQNSPLLKLLSPDQSEGLLAMLRGVVEERLRTHGELFSKEFSLDNPDGALARMIRELVEKHGNLAKALQDKVEELKKDFSFDEENSSLNRLKKNVDHAHNTIVSQFSLDNEQSALRRMQTHLETILGGHFESSAKFQEEVKIALAKLVTKRETEARGTQHGATFEQAVFEFVQQHAGRRGDVAELKANEVGQIKNCKVGDVVCELGPEHLAAGARIVVEAKDEARRSLASARGEMEEARKNRGAQHGVFVFSKQTAPAEVQPLCRLGADVFVAWDAEDPTTDAYLQAALEICRALCVADRREAVKHQFDFDSLDKTINAIEKCAGNLDVIGAAADTIIKTANDKILERVRKDKAELDRQIRALRDAVGGVKELLGGEASA